MVLTFETLATSTILDSPILLSHFFQIFSNLVEGNLSEDEWWRKLLLIINNWVKLQEFSSYFNVPWMNYLGYFQFAGFIIHWVGAVWLKSIPNLADFCCMHVILICRQSANLLEPSLGQKGCTMRLLTFKRGYPKMQSNDKYFLLMSINPNSQPIHSSSQCSY